MLALREHTAKYIRVTNCKENPWNVKFLVKPSNQNLWGQADAESEY